MTNAYMTYEIQANDRGHFNNRLGMSVILVLILISDFISQKKQRTFELDLNDALRSNLKKNLKNVYEKSKISKEEREKKKRKREEKEEKKRREEEREKVSVYRGHGTQTPVAVVPAEQNLY